MRFLARLDLAGGGGPRYSEGWMDLAAFDYHLPEELIAQQPLADRAASRMLVVYRDRNRWEDRLFRELPSFLHPGDCLVLNDSRVFPARLFGQRQGTHALALGKNNSKLHEYLSGRVEVFLLRPVSADGKEWEALVRPGRKMRTGERIHFSDRLEGMIAARGEYGERRIRFECAGDPFDEFEKIGHVPLPPYIKRPDQPADRERYQTVFAREKGSVAAPTAGLHFTPEVLDQCRAAGAAIAYVTLHVGLGTFQPLHAAQVEQGKLHAERFSVGAEDAAAVNAASRLVAVGTTSVRTLESAVRQVTDLPTSPSQRPHIAPCHGETDIFIYPGYQFRAVGAMLTNFHLPGTSLLLLVCAFAGTDLALAAYRHAVEEKYRFYSYGDCMLIV